MKLKAVRSTIACCASVALIFSGASMASATTAAQSPSQTQLAKLGLEINTASLPNGNVGVRYSSQVKISGGSPMGIALTAGKLPDGLSLDTVTSVISGVPTKTGRFTFTLTLSGLVGVMPGADVSREFTITIGTQPPTTKPPTTKPPTVAGECTTARDSSVFVDMSPSQKFYKEIDWMHCKRLTTGTKTDLGLSYGPKLELTREAMAAFIYRLEKPAAFTPPKQSPFADVSPSDKFYTEIAWMWDRGLSTGTKQPSGKPLFAPKESLTREAMAAFIYRLEKPSGYSVPGVSALIDMRPGDKFFAEVSWMYSEGLSTGIKTPGGKAFDPKAALSREAMAAFIYRLVNVYRKA